MIGRERIVAWLELLAKRFEENRGYLTELDAAIGDADHGINMERGFRKVLAGLGTSGGKDIGAILRDAGMALIGSVGGASGPLYGTFFMKAGEAAAGKQVLDARELAEAFRGGAAALAARGKARRGDKTILDSLEPAVDALEAAAGNGLDVRKALESAVDAARRGLKETIPMIARKGRASYLGERSAGHQDPGAASCCLIVEALGQAVEGP